MDDQGKRLYLRKGNSDIPGKAGEAGRCHGRLQLRKGSCKGIVENLDEYYTVVVQANCEKDTLFLECIVRDEQDIAMLKEWCQGIKHRVTISDELHS